MKTIKKCICCLLLISVIVSAAVITAAAASSYKRGDADSDGNVTILDSTAIQRKLADLSVASFDEKAADVDGDGLNILDATKIQRFLADFSDPYNIGEVVTVQPTENNYELPFIPI